MYKNRHFAVVLALVFFAGLSIPAYSQEIPSGAKFSLQQSQTLSNLPMLGGGAFVPKISNVGNANANPGVPNLPATSIATTKPDAPSNEGRTSSEVGSEFQKFIANVTGKNLPVFGAEFFANAPSTFTPIHNIPVPSDYLLGPGDEVLVRGWGAVEIDYRATLDRNGLINLPSIGSIVLGGVKANEAENVIRRAVEKFYKGVTLNVTFGQLRAITVYVVGQARRPGTYTVSSLSTLVTALFASGGPNANGSMRHVQVKRGRNVVAELDLYAFIAKGDKSADVKLQDGDTLFIPTAAAYAALVGKVNSPAIYELHSPTDTVASLLDFAGGLPVTADPRRAFLERIDPQQRQPRTVEEFALDKDGLRKSLKNGDLLTITSITPEFANAVTLRGNVDQAIRAPFKQGMRVSDLIPNREYLITRASLQQQNNSLLQGDNETKFGSNAGSIAANIGNLMDPINWDYAVVERINRANLSVSLIPFNLGKALENPTGAGNRINPENIALQAGDIVTIFSQSDVRVPIEKRRIFVRIEGEVNVPGVYQMNSGETLLGLLAKAGGPTSNAYLFGTEFYREQVRKEQEANLEKVMRRLETQLRNAQSKNIANSSAQVAVDAQLVEARRQSEAQAANDALNRLKTLKPTGRITFGLEPTDRSFNKLPALKLENGDQLVIPNKPDFIHLYGAVNQESSVLWRPGLKVGEYLNRAGPTESADIDNIFVIRADGSVLSSQTNSWIINSISRAEVMPGDSIVVPEKLNKETMWTQFIAGTKDWAQIFSGFGLGAAAIKTLK